VQIYYLRPLFRTNGNKRKTTNEKDVLPMLHPPPPPEVPPVLVGERLGSNVGERVGNPLGTGDGETIGVGVTFTSGVTVASFDIPSWYPPVTTSANQYFRPDLSDVTVTPEVYAFTEVFGTSRYTASSSFL
jgi:hypothetical protein